MGRRRRSASSLRSAVLDAVKQVETDVVELERVFHRIFARHQSRKRSGRSAGSAQSSASNSSGSQHEWHVQCDVLHALLTDALDDNRYPSNITLAAARKLKKWEELLLGTKSTRWLDLFAEELSL